MRADDPASLVPTLAPGDPAVLADPLALGSGATEVSLPFPLGSCNSLRVAVVVANYRTLTRLTVWIDQSNDACNWTPGLTSLQFSSSGYGTFGLPAIAFRFARLRYTTLGSGTAVLRAVARRFRV